MSKAEKGKAGKAEVVVNVETNNTGKEKFVWSSWDSLLYDFLTAIQEAGMEARENKSNFTAMLQIKLQSNGDLVTKVKDNPKLAERIVNSLPCGHGICYQFIREVSQSR